MGEMISSCSSRIVGWAKMERERQREGIGLDGWGGDEAGEPGSECTIGKLIFNTLLTSCDIKHGSYLAANFFLNPTYHILGVVRGTLS